MCHLLWETLTKKAGKNIRNEREKKHHLEKRKQKMNLSLQREIGTQKKMYILFGQKKIRAEFVC